MWEWVISGGRPVEVQLKKVQRPLACPLAPPISSTLYTGEWFIRFWGHRIGFSKVLVWSIARRHRVLEAHMTMGSPFPRPKPPVSYLKGRQVLLWEKKTSVFSVQDTRPRQNTFFFFD